MRHPDWVTNPTLHTHLSFPLTKGPLVQASRKARILVQPTSRISEIAAEMAYNGEQCAADSSTVILTVL